MSLTEIFNAGLKHHHVANTAYPPSRKVFEGFDVETSKESIIKAWNNVDELGIYVHIPFCERISSLG